MRKGIDTLSALCYDVYIKGWGVTMFFSIIIVDGVQIARGFFAESHTQSARNAFDHFLSNVPFEGIVSVQIETEEIPSDLPFAN